MSNLLLKSNDRIYTLKTEETLLYFTMTSNTSPAPYVASASSQNGASAYHPYFAFNGTNSTATDCWMTAQSTSTGWLKIDLGKSIDIYAVQLTSRNHSTTYNTNSPKNFTIQGSNDNSSFEILGTYTNQTWTQSETRKFELDKKGKYRYIRINVTANNGGTQLAIAQFRIYQGARDLTELGEMTLNNFTKHGYSKLTIDNFNSINENKKYILQDSVSKNSDGLWVQELNRKPLSISCASKMCFELDNSYYTVSGGNISQITKDEVKTLGFNNVNMSENLYNRFSETPKIAVYTESTTDITITTTTEPYTFYDEFGDEVEALYYTDSQTVTQADLILEANWSPVDELEGNFEVVTWTDEAKETAHRVLDFTGIPKPQFIKLAKPKRLYGYLKSILSNDVSTTYKFTKDTRYLLTDTEGNDWYVWDSYSQSFVKVEASTHELIFENGMTEQEIKSITDKQWNTWEDDYVNIGIFLKDNPRNTIVSVINSVSYSDFLPRYSTKVKKGSFYILNTTAKIDLELTGNVIHGVLSDDDLTRVQYRVFVNNKAYYPADGEFIPLGDSPTNIEVVIPSKDIIIDDWNTVKVEFQDFYGATDYWQTQFVGTYSGLVFKDIHGDYYSNEIGEVLKYLDFGVIIAGQTTLEHEIILKNQYGYDIKNIHLYAETNELPQGTTIEFSEYLSPFIPESELKLSYGLQNDEETSFYIRIKTELGSTPNANGSFDIVVRADKV